MFYEVGKWRFIQQDLCGLVLEEARDKVPLHFVGKIWRMNMAVISRSDWKKKNKELCMDNYGGLKVVQVAIFSNGNMGCNET